MTTRSMTGYAVTTRDTVAGTVTIEIKSVNSRFLDVQFRMNDDLRAVEPALREAIVAWVRETGHSWACRAPPSERRAAALMTPKGRKNPDDYALASTSHPEPDLLKVHDPEKFGCSPCHQGNGRATTSVEKAHGYYEHWLWPLFRKANVEAGCQSCHPDDLKERALWKQYAQAYEDVLNETSTDHAPWTVVPADHRWFRDWVVAGEIVRALKELKMEYPKPDTWCDQLVGIPRVRSSRLRSRMMDQPDGYRCIGAGEGRCHYAMINRDAPYFPPVRFCLQSSKSERHCTHFGLTTSVRRTWSGWGTVTCYLVGQ